MSYGTKDVQVEERKSLGIAFGILKLKIMDFNLKKATSSDKKMLEFFLEDDQPVKDDGYEYEGVFGKRKAQFRQGKAAASIYIDIEKDTAATDLILKSLASLADKTGTRAALDAVEANDFLDYLTKAIKAVGNQYAYFVVKAEEYINKTTGKVGINRTLKSWGKDAPLIIFPVEGSTVVKDGNTQTITTADGKTYTWDKSNTYDYKPVAKPDAETLNTQSTAPDVTSDLPF